MDDNHRTEQNQLSQAEQEEAAEPPQPESSGRLNLVADEDAAEYEEQQTGVRFSFVLRKEEFYEALSRENARGPARKKQLRLLSAIGVFIAVCLILGFAMPDGGRFFRIAFAGVFVEVLLWLSTVLRLRGLAKQLTTGEEISVAVYPDEVGVAIGSNHWNIPLDDTAKMDSTPRILTLHSEGRSLVIPVRSIDPAIRADVLAILMAGTRKFS